MLVLCAALCGGALSHLASERPDGLEWAIEASTEGQGAAEPQGKTHHAMANAQDSTKIMPDYALENEAPIGTSLAGLLGGAIVLLLATGIGLTMRSRKQKKPDDPIKRDEIFDDDIRTDHAKS